jgi:hypothetical protein
LRKKQTSSASNRVPGARLLFSRAQFVSRMGCRLAVFLARRIEKGRSTGGPL